MDGQLSSHRVLERLTELFAQRGVPEYIRANARVRPGNGTEFTARRVRQWLADVTLNTRGVAQQLPSNRVSGCRSSSQAVRGRTACHLW